MMDNDVFGIMVMRQVAMEETARDVIENNIPLTLDLAMAHGLIDPTDDEWEMMCSMIRGEF